MADCGCAAYAGCVVHLTTEDYARNAIEADNKKFFSDYVEQKTQASLASIKINSKYTVIEYAVLRNRRKLVEYLLDDAKFGWALLKQEKGDRLNEAMNILCTSACPKQAFLAVENARAILNALSKKGVAIETYENILDAPIEIPPDAGESKKCSIM